MTACLSHEVRHSTAYKSDVSYTTPHRCSTRRTATTAIGAFVRCSRCAITRTLPAPSACCGAPRAATARPHFPTTKKEPDEKSQPLPIHIAGRCHFGAVCRPRHGDDQGRTQGRQDQHQRHLQDRQSGLRRHDRQCQGCVYRGSPGKRKGRQSRARIRLLQQAGRHDPGGHRQGRVDLCGCQGEV